MPTWKTSRWSNREIYIERNTPAPLSQYSMVGIFILMLISINSFSYKNMKIAFCKKSIFVSSKSKQTT